MLCRRLVLKGNPYASFPHIDFWTLSLRAPSRAAYRCGTLLRSGHRRVNCRFRSHALYRFGTHLHTRDLHLWSAKPRVLGRMPFRGTCTHLIALPQLPCVAISALLETG